MQEASKREEKEVASRREIRIDQGEEGDGSRSSRLPRGHVSPKAVKSEGRTRPWGKDSRHFRLVFRLRYLRSHRGDNSCQIRRKPVNDRTKKHDREKITIQYM